MAYRVATPVSHDQAFHYTGMVCQLNYHGGGSLQYTSDGKPFNIPFLQPPRSQPLQIGQEVRFSIIEQKAVDVEPADLQLKLSERPKIGSTRDEIRDEKDHLQSRGLQKSIWALSQFGQFAVFRPENFRQDLAAANNPADFWEKEVSEAVIAGTIQINPTIFINFPNYTLLYFPPS